MIDPKKILVLAPHTDDGELGCGGSIAKFTAAGKQVWYAAFSRCAKSLPADLPATTLEDECRKATALLGIRGADLIFFDHDVREFPANRQTILDQLIQLNKTIQPDLVFLPSASDIHQDHQVINQEGIRAFKNCTVAGYELPWNNTQFQTNLFIRLESNDLEKKINALKLYRSQSHRNYMKDEFIRSLARVRGVQCNYEYAEAFELIKLIS